MQARTRVTKQERAVMAKVRSGELSISEAMKKLAMTNYSTFYTVYFHCNQKEIEGY
jgi:hypothetical protein